MVHLVCRGRPPPVTGKVLAAPAVGHVGWPTELTQVIVFLVFRNAPVSRYRYLTVHIPTQPPP